MTKEFRSVSKILVYIFLLIVGAGASVWFILNGNKTLLICAAAVTIFAVYKIYRLYTDSMRKVSFMFNAIDCDDYNFRFTDEQGGVNNYMLNYSLNRIKEILSNAKIRAMEHEKYYELIMGSVKTGIITINDRGNVFQVNGEALRLLGLDIFTHVDQLNTIDSALAAALKEIKAGEKRRHSLRHEMGETKLSLGASSVTYDGRPLKIVSMNDINSAIDDNEMESWIKLTRILTHEIMNSLAPITSLSDTLIAINEEGSPQVTEGLQTIRNTGQTLISFVESYRKFTRLQKPVKTPFEIRPSIDRAVSLICAESSVEATVCVNPEDTMVYADEDMVNQLLVNIVKNAVQAVECRKKTEGENFAGRLSVCVYVAEDEKVVLQISNNGGAIPPETAKDIFLPFFTTRENGSGIGLSVCRQIMHLHGGSIHVTSNTDKEVTFTLEFP